MEDQKLDDLGDEIARIFAEDAEISPCEVTAGSEVSFRLCRGNFGIQIVVGATIKHPKGTISSRRGRFVILTLAGCGTVCMGDTHALWPSHQRPEDRAGFIALARLIDANASKAVVVEVEKISPAIRHPNGAFEFVAW
ncbi:MAG: hypothetical protein ABIF09_18635 [Gemmatimonadota bacterium]